MCCIQAQMNSVEGEQEPEAETEEELFERQLDKRQDIFDQAKSCKSLLLQLKNGQHILDLEGHSSQTNLNKLLQILHFRQYVRMYKYAFENWSTDCMEQIYIEVGNEARDLLELLEDDVFKETMFSLLMIRADLDNKSIEDTHETYLNQIGREWVEAGLIQDCTRGDDA